MSTKNFIHIGLPKTGTTWLQHKLFPTFKGSYICGHVPSEHSALSIEDWRKLRWYCIDCHDVIAQENKERCQDPLKALKTPVLFSEEALSGSMLNGQEAVAQRLQNCFGNAEIILVIREPMDMLRSLYMQISMGFGGKNYAYIFSDFIDAALLSYDPDYRVRKPGFKKHVPVHNILSRLRYDRIAAIYQEVFGQDNVHIFSYEGLFFGAEMPKLCALLDVPTPSDLKTRSKTMQSYTEYKKNLAQGAKGFQYFERYFWALADKAKLYQSKDAREELQFTPEQLNELQNIFQPVNDWIASHSDCRIETYGYSHSDETDLKKAS